MNEQGTGLGALQRLDLGQYAEALALYDAGELPAGLVPDSAEAILWQAEIALYSGRCEEAATALAGFTGGGECGYADVAHRKLVLDAQLLHESGAVDQAMDAYAHAVVRAERTGDRQTVMRAALGLAKLKRRAGDWEACLEELDAVARIAGEAGNLFYLGQCQFHAGACLFELNQLDAAEASYLGALERLAAEGLRLQALVRTMYPSVLMATDRFCEAISILNAAADVQAMHGWEEDYSRNRHMLTWALFGCGRLTEAVALINALIPADRERKDAYGELCGYRLLATTEIWRGNLDAAKAAAETAAMLARLGRNALAQLETDLLEARLAAHAGSREALDTLARLSRDAEMSTVPMYADLTRIYIADSMLALGDSGAECAYWAAYHAARHDTHVWVRSELALLTDRILERGGLRELAPGVHVVDTRGDLTPYPTWLAAIERIVALAALSDGDWDTRAAGLLVGLPYHAMRRWLQRLDLFGLVRSKKGRPTADRARPVVRRGWRRRRPRSD